MILGRSVSFNKRDAQDAINNRTINSFPPPYIEECTPYKIGDFSDWVKDRTSDVKPTDSVLDSKIIVLGDVCVGKTSLVNRFCHQNFDGTYKATIGVDIEVQRFELLNTPFNIQIWDTAGQERFKCLAQAYYRHAHVVLLIFDLINLGTLENCKKWLNEALKSTINHPYVFLVGTKKDILEEAAYHGIEKFATKIAEEINAEYWAISAKTGEGVQQLFRRIVALAFNRIFEKQDEMFQSIKLGSPTGYDSKRQLEKRNSCMGCQSS